jgi:hypothetical protein
MFNALRHRRFAWVHAVLGVWLCVFSSYALSMQARMQVEMAFKATSMQDAPCPDHGTMQADTAAHHQAPQDGRANNHDCPICHLIGSGWVQTAAAFSLRDATPNAAPHGRLFQAVEFLQPTDSPPPNF